MRTRIRPIDLLADEAEQSAVFEQLVTEPKLPPRHRPMRSPKRRSSRNPTASVPLGIAARRQRRWDF